MVKPNDIRPVKWGNPKRQDRRKLQLTEIAILRRMARGEGTSATATALGMSRGGVGEAKRRMREAFGVDDNHELLAHPDVIAQLEAGS